MLDDDLYCPTHLVFFKLGHNIVRLWKKLRMCAVNIAPCVSLYFTFTIIGDFVNKLLI